ncbi:MAG: sorting and assembly machinery component 50 [Muribaculaceae bacterium]|nr:sorting and assembly machinery component 50 [Muribaculaceae bacterium]
MKRKSLLFRILLPLIAIAVSCSPVKHVPQGEYLLDKVKIETTGTEGQLDTEELVNFLRQAPNHKVLGFAKLQLATYSLSGADTTRWYNRWLRRIGQAPVIYDPELTEASRRQLEQAIVNRGYLNATVSTDTISNPAKKRMEVRYLINAGSPHRISSIDYNIDDPAVRHIVLADTSVADIHAGMPLDRTMLDNERTRIATILRNAGYFEFNREFINYTADTVAGSKDVALTLNLRSPSARISESGQGSRTRLGALADSLLAVDPGHHRYEFNRVVFLVEGEGGLGNLRDTVEYHGKTFVYSDDCYLRPQLLDDMCYIEPGSEYSARAIERTYEALGRLSIVKFINIEMEAAGRKGSTGLLDAYIHLSRNKKQGITAELEGTNSEGDLGFGLGLTYQHRNLARGSETLTTKLRASYESLSGNVDGLVNNRYTEYAAEVGITFPQFECPFLSKRIKQKFLASTEFAVSFNYQERPEYTRIIAGAAWKWKWQQQRTDELRRQTFDLIDINYVRLPRSTINFIDQIAPSNPLLRYSYEDHFIMRLGYTYSHTNRRVATATSNAFSIQPYVTSLRVSGETAGNLLYGLSSLVGQKRSDGVYKILGIQYAQYVKGEIDYTYTRNLNSRNALSAHVGFGIAVPYGNSSMVPFEKRFYAGGANSVRGWGVRTLGPGAYDARNSVTDFINQCGDIRLDLSLEYRAKLFWVFEGALFIDAGNIWTIRNYENQPGGEFKFNKFYKQIAAAYGVGLRMDFTYFLLRFDLGFKAHNPAQGQEAWPLLHPKWSRDANFHFAVGYPF